MYVKNKVNTLLSEYSKKSLSTRLSNRIVNRFERYNYEILNMAVNSCDSWNTFCDIGASDGRLSWIMLNNGFKKGYAIEVSDNEQLTKLGKEFKNLVIYNKLIQEVNFKDKIDFIVLSDVFEHIPLSDMSQFIDKLSSMQRGGESYIY